jgi:putative membrane protein insertion efficiency factor
VLSKYFGGHCVFQPSCSEYAKISIQTNDFFYGWYQTIKRILRCKQPNGGIDYPEIREKT